MSGFTQKWAVVSLLEEVVEGSEFHRADFPVHLTLAGVFAASQTGQQLADGLAGVLIGQSQVEIKADDEDLFGPEKNVLVTRIEKSSELMDLYERIYGWLGEVGVEYNSPQYQGDGFLPHVTRQKSGNLVPGEIRRLVSVSLIDLYPGEDWQQRKVVRTIGLG